MQGAVTAQTLCCRMGAWLGSLTPFIVCMVAREAFRVVNFTRCRYRVQVCEVL